MNKLSNTKVAVSTYVKKNRPMIFTSIGIIGSMTAIFATIKATRKADERLIEALDEKGPNAELEDLSKKEYLKAVVPPYIPVVIIEAGSILCIFGGQNMQARRTAAFATAYGIKDELFREYKQKVIDTVGKKKEKDIQSSVLQDKLQKKGIDEIIDTGKGDTLCFDAGSGRYFLSNKTSIENAKNIVNQKISHDDGFALLNDFYEAVGLPPTKYGEFIGWDRELMEIYYEYGPNKDGEPVMIIDYEISPTYIF